MRRFVTIVFLLAVVLAVALLSCGEQPGRREFNQGRHAMEDGRYVRAKNLFEKSINKRPGSEENALAYNYLGIANWHLDQLEAAIDAFEDSRRLKPERFQPTYNLGVLIYKSGNTARALDLLEEASLIDKDDTRALEYQGYIHIQDQNWADSRRVFHMAASRAPHSPRIITALSFVEMQLDGPERADFYLMQALDKNADYAPALYNLGLLNRDYLDNLPQALSFFYQFVQLSPDAARTEAVQSFIDQNRPSKTPPAAPENDTPKKPEEKIRPQPVTVPQENTAENISSGVEKARAAAIKGKTQLALNYYLKAAADAARIKDTSRQGGILEEAVEKCFEQSRAHIALGRFCLDQKKNACALQAFKEAVVLSPKKATPHLGLAEAALLNNEYDTAAIALKNAVALAPENPDALWTLASLYENELDWNDRALECYRQFEQFFPGDPRVLKAREKRYKAAPPLTEPDVSGGTKKKTPPHGEDINKETPLREIPARRLDLKKPRQRQRGAAIQAYNRGTLYQSREDWDRAIYYYRSALENDDSYTSAYFNLAAVYRLNGDLDYAKDAYLSALEWEPDNPATRYNLSLIYLDLKQETAAEAQLKKILAKNPEHASAHYVLGMIYAKDPSRNEQTREHWRKFLSLAPNDQRTPAIRRWLAANL